MNFSSLICEPQTHLLHKSMNPLSLFELMLECLPLNRASKLCQYFGLFLYKLVMTLCIIPPFKTLLSSLVTNSLSLSIKRPLNVSASSCTACSLRREFFYSVLCSECHLQLWKSFSYPFSSQTLKLLLMNSFFYCLLCLKTFPFTISMPKFEELNSYKSNL